MAVAPVAFSTHPLSHRWVVRLVLSIGFWAPFMYAHWCIASTSWVARTWPLLNYPGVSVVTLGIVWCVAAAFGRTGRAPLGPRWLGRAVLAAVASGCVVVLGCGDLGSAGGAVAAMALGSLAMLALQIPWWNRYARVDTLDFALSLCLGIAVLGLLKIAMVALGDVFVCAAGLLPWVCGFGLRFLGDGEQGRGEAWFTPRVLGSLGRLAVGVLAFLAIWSLFNAYLKATTGHQGFGSTASAQLTVCIQVIDIGFAGLLAWWIAVRKGQVEYVQLWKAAYVCLGAAILFFWGSRDPCRRCRSSRPRRLW